MARVVHFDIQADDPERAIKFYGEAFGWKFDKWAGPMDYWLITTGPDSEPGINGGLNKRGPQSPPNANTIGVDSIDEACSKVQAAGGKVLQPKMPIPGVGWFAFCQDTEGNPFGMMQADEGAH